MHIFEHITHPSCAGEGAVALGFFDGVHLGHQAVIQAAVGHAQAEGLFAGVFTFSLPLSASFKQGRICTEETKHRQMQALGVHCYWEPAFEEFCGLSPSEFVNQVLAGQLRARAVFCGDNFTFGKRAAGNVATLRQLCAPLGIQVHIIPMAQHQGQPISSTRIRAALEAGDIPAATAMLGRPYAIRFPVNHGKGLGRTLGFPTVNQIYPQGFILPKYGIYITRIQVGGDWYAGATGLGERPTVNTTGEGPTCETFIPGFEGDLYNQTPCLEFHQYLAPSQRFDTLEQLTACVKAAAQKAQDYFAGQ